MNIKTSSPVALKSLLKLEMHAPRCKWDFESMQNFEWSQTGCGHKPVFGRYLVRPLIETFTAELDLPPEQQNTWKLCGAKIDDAAQWLPNRSFDAPLHRLARPKIFSSGVDKALNGRSGMPA